jgi:hypothetical protein
MHYRSLLSVTAVVLLAGALGGCEHGTTAPERSVTPARRMPIEPIDPIDPPDPTPPPDPLPVDPVDPNPTPPQPVPFLPPPPPFAVASDLPLVVGGFDSLDPQSCEQIAHVGVAFSNDVVRGTILYGWGVVVPGSRAVFGFYNQFGQRVKTRVTNGAHSNCVINHEPEIIDTSDLVPGYYFVYSSYWGLSSNFVFDTYSGRPIGHPGKYITTIRIR